MAEQEARRECCGIPWTMRQITITSDHRGTTMLCSMCQGLIDAGMLRPETVEGKHRYRRWIFEWAPGDLVPEIPEVAAVRER